MSESIWSDLVGSAKQEAESFETRRSSNDEEYTPMVFLREGSHKIRIYPDKSNPHKIRLIRKIFFHKADVPGKEVGKMYKVRVRCEGEGNCKICKVMDEANKLGYEGSWKHKNVTGLAYGVIYDSSEKSDYVKTGVPVVIALENKMIYAINKMMSELSGSELQRIIDSLDERNIIEIDHKPGSGGNTMARFSINKLYSLPPLPTHFKPLDEVYIPNSPGSDENVKAICEAIMSKIKSKTNEVVQPDGSIAGKPKQESSLNDQTSKNIFTGLPGVVAKNPAGVELPPGSPPCYGARPKAGHAICVACPIEIKCSKQTLSNELAARV